MRHATDSAADREKAESMKNAGAWWASVRRQTVEVQ
jgi:hypothetical protein